MYRGVKNLFKNIGIFLTQIKPQNSVQNVLTHVLDAHLFLNALPAKLLNFFTIQFVTKVVQMDTMETQLIENVKSVIYLAEIVLVQHNV